MDFLQYFNVILIYCYILSTIFPLITSFVLNRCGEYKRSVEEWREPTSKTKFPGDLNRFHQRCFVFAYSLEFQLQKYIKDVVKTQKGRFRYHMGKPERNCKRCNYIQQCCKSDLEWQIYRYVLIKKKAPRLVSIKILLIETLAS